MTEEKKPDMPGGQFIAEKLFQKRQIIITGQISERTAHMTSASLLALSADSDEPINLFISSPGGHVESGDMIYDMIKFVKAPVRIIGSGWVASAGALIFIAAKKENRYCLPNTRFLLHQPSGGMGGPASDIAIQAEQIIKMKDRLNHIFAHETGQPLAKIAKDTDRDFWMDPQQAIDYGLLHKVIHSEAEIY
jgi:ATP-dependent Clp protease protease subunit